MDNSSKKLQQPLPDNDNMSDSTREEITEADIEELENMLPRKRRKPSPTGHELRVFKACQQILKNSCGVISTSSLTSRAETDAANILVDDCLLIFIIDLFKDEDFIEPEGFVKDVPNGFDILFCGRLARYGLTFETYMKSIIIPDIWKSYLSANGLRFLSNIVFYQNLLNLPLCQLSDDVQSMDHDLVNHFDQQTEPSDLRPSYTTQSPNILDDELEGISNVIDTLNNIIDNIPTNISKDNCESETTLFTTDHSNNDKYKPLTSTPKNQTLNNKSIFIQQLHHPSVLLNDVLMNWNNLRTHVVGLINPGKNVCYINAALQCLASTPPLVDWLLEKNKFVTCELLDNGSFCSICELKKIISSIAPSSKVHGYNDQPFTVASADNITTNVHMISALFQVGEQDDASLFLTSFLDHCKDCLPLHASIFSFNTRPQTVIHQIFGIQLTSTVQCLSCLNTYTKEEESMNVLPIQINNINDLSKALTHFFDEEILMYGDVYECSSCDIKVKAKKRLTIRKLSPILIINMKRSFVYDGLSIKLCHQVNYNEVIDLYPYMASEQCDLDEEKENKFKSPECLYKLYGVITHYGDNLESGHYCSYIRTSNNKWFFVDDAHHRPASSSEVLNNNNAYILFYAKINVTNKKDSVTISRLPLQSLTTQNHTLVQSPSNFDVSILRNKPISSIEKMISETEPYSNNKSCTKIARTVTLNNIDCQNNLPPNSNNIVCHSDQEQNVNVDMQVQPGHTESTITIVRNYPKMLSNKTKTNTNQINAIKPSFLSISSSHSSDSSDSSDRPEQPSINLTNHSSTLTQKEANRTLASVASGTSMQEAFEKKLPDKHQFRLKPTDVIKLNGFRQEELEKQYDRRMENLGLASDSSYSSLKMKQLNRGTTSVITNTFNKKLCWEEDLDNITNRKVNIEYLILLLPYLERYNSFCSLCICTRYFGKNTSKPTSLLVRINLKCNGEHCEFQCNVHIFNNGYGFIVAINPTSFHPGGTRVARPLRGSQRQNLMTELEGNCVYRIHAKYDKKRTKEQRQAFNYNLTGKSKKIFKKIKAEAQAASLLSPNVTLGILKLHDKLVDEINAKGIISGGLPLIQLRPFCIVGFTEASIRLYDAIVTCPDSTISWDATGGIVRNTSTKQSLYYELTITHPNIVNEDSLIPLTFMLSESQTLFTVVQWLSTFKECHKKIFPHKKDSFPRPSVILSDRAQIFLQASLRVFNDETYQQFLARAYRIVTNAAIRDDLCKTNIHSCLAHFMLDMRKRVNKYVVENLRELAMWSIALLVNTSTWPEIKENWRLICQVFLSYSSNDDINYKKYSAKLVHRISKITNDANASKAINQSKELSSNHNDPYDFADDTDLDDYDNNQLRLGKNVPTDKSKKKSNKKNTSIIDEERELNNADSAFKKELQSIYYDCCQTNIEHNPNMPSLDKSSKGIRQWLSYLNQYCIPTIPIWSNLLLGNLSRHGKRSVRAFDGLLLSTHDQRTNAISERRMAIVKRTQLGTETRIRSDIVLEILVEDMKRMVEHFCISYMATMSKGQNDDANCLQLKDLCENWKGGNQRGHGHYTKRPEPQILNNLKNDSFPPLLDINTDLIIPQLPVVNWLNVVIGLLLSIKIIREKIPILILIEPPLVVDIRNFIKNWLCYSNRIKARKKISLEQSQLLNTNFNIPSDVPVDINDQVTYIIRNILLPIVPHQISIKKIYHCSPCKITIEVLANIEIIEINMVNNQFQLYNQLANYFTGGTSDYLCYRCNTYMHRQINILHCPPVIILKINGLSTSTVSSYKPPGSLDFSAFLDNSSIVCSSSTVFDVVSFVSFPADGKKQLVLSTKIKQRWNISSIKRLIGNGARLAKEFGNSRIIILERLRTSDTNFLHAIIKCCATNINIEYNDIEPCKTLRDAVQIIENNEVFHQIHQLLISDLTTYYQCQKCRSASKSLSSTHKCICIYEPEKEKLSAHGAPVLWKNLSSLYCSICNEKTDDIMLPIHTQVHHQYPSILMYHLSRTSLDFVYDLRIELSDLSQRKHIYKPTSVLLVDIYDAISVIQLKELFVFPSDPYETPIPHTRDGINDLFDTSRKSIVFLKPVDTNINEINNNNQNVQQTKPTTTTTTAAPAPAPSSSVLPQVPAPEITTLVPLPSPPPVLLQAPAPQTTTTTTFVSSSQRTTTTTATCVSLGQPITVRLLNNSTNISKTGTIRSVTFVSK